MAILKHIASKNADYTEAERYLTFQHDEDTGKMILDEDGYPMLREKFLMEGILCDASTFARECRKANKQFGKNKKKSEIKTHHYILSFDPKDRELGLTMETAQRLGMEFAQKHFPGHQALVCTHDEGHNESGNVHVHIVLNSLRIQNTEELPFQMRPCDTKAGYKHHCSKEYLSYLQNEVMQMCRDHGLHQVNLKGSDRRITDAEYHAQQHGQKALDAENKVRAANGTKPVQTKFETEKEKIRRAILDVIDHSADEDEFKKKLLEIYGIRVKESRGRWSYLPPGRKKPITGRKLGDAFEKTAVQKSILGIEPVTFDHSGQKSHVPETALTGTEGIGRIIDLENNEKVQTSAGYAYWAKLHNLQEQAKTLNYLFENGLLDGARLDRDLADASEAYQQSHTELKATEERLRQVNRELRLLGQYYKTKGVYREYAKTGKRKGFYGEHRAELELFEAASKELREIFGGEKLPTIQALKQEKAELSKKKEVQYELFKTLRTQWMELSKLVQNRDSLMQNMQTQRGNKPII